MGRYCKKSGRGSVGPSDTVVLHLPLAEAQPEPEMQLWGELQTPCESLGGEVRAIRSAAELGCAEPLEKRSWEAEGRPRGEEMTGCSAGSGSSRPSSRGFC